TTADSLSSLALTGDVDLSPASGRLSQEATFSVSIAPLSGDYNSNKSVDSADYVIWRKNLGSKRQLPNQDPSATPGSVTGQDYAAWRSRFGQSETLSVVVPVDRTNATVDDLVDDVNDALMAASIAAGLGSDSPLTARRAGNKIQLILTHDSGGSARIALV